MKKPNMAQGALVGLFLTAPLMAILFLANRLAGLAFTPFVAFDWLRDRLPGAVLVKGIETLAKTLSALGFSVRAASKPAEIIMVLGLFLLLGVLAAAAFFAVSRRLRSGPGISAGLILGGILGAPLAVIGWSGGKALFASAFSNALWTLAAFLLWGNAVVRAYRRMAGGRSAKEGDRLMEPSVARLSRRRFLVRVGGAGAAVTVAGAALGSLLKREDVFAEAAPPPDGAAGAGADSAGATAAPVADLEPAPGTRPEYTPLKDHYRIDITLSPPHIDGKRWSLPVTGLVNKPMTLTLDDLRTKYESVDRVITLSCISNEIGGDLIGTTRWTGASLARILDDAGVKEEARYLQLESADGFFETVPLALIRQDARIMLVYAWDGQPLLVEHGFPLRIYIPDRYGMKQPKWIIRARLTAEDRAGYWVERGWDRLARVKATSVIDTVAVKDIGTGTGGEKLIPVGGIAYAGARGISKVQVKVDEGGWSEARLRRPLSDTTWVIWRFDWPFSPGSHVFSVRCREADDTPQIETPAGTFPSGATGVHRLKKKI